MVKKIIRVFIISYSIFISILFTAWSVWHIMDNGKMIPQPIAKGILAFAEFPSHIYHTLVPTSVPYNIFDPRQITDSTSKDGITLFTESSNFSSTALLISTFLSSKKFVVKLVGVPNGSLIKQWDFNADESLSSMLNKEENNRLVHPLMTKDSSIIIKNANGNLISIDINNKLKWIDSSTKHHHSIEFENDSTVWTPAIAKNFKYYKIDSFSHDAICAIDPRNGKVKFIKSVPDMLIENGYQSLLDLYYENDAIHLNDIQPAMYSSKFWKKGDLLISMRHRNTVALYRPSTNKILWLKTGPWLAQHDCDFVDGKTIMIFGNDLLRGQHKSPLINGHNDIYFYDFEKNEVTKPYTKVMKKLGIKTISEGRCDLLTNGDLFVDETNYGKLYIINKDSLKMTYTERYDKNHIKMFNWVRPILN
jgi:hypothetical protein